MRVVTLHIMQNCVLGIMLFAANAGRAQAAEMPFIEVDPNSRISFRQRGTGNPFVMVGLNYFDHETGWAPKLWHKFDEQRVRRQLALVRGLGLNTIRVFLTLDSFHHEPGKVHPEGEAKFRQLVSICRELGIYLMPTGPAHWEGAPKWRKNTDAFADESILKADETWWRDFAGQFKDESVILAWDLLNEPSVGWGTAAMKPKWNDWLQRKYGLVEKMASAWKVLANGIAKFGGIEAPPKKSALNDQRLYDYQLFREYIGDEWTKRLVNAIRTADKNHLITIGHIQWAVPVYLPVVSHYAGFNIQENSRHVDFVTIHFYPISPPLPSTKPEGMTINATYFEALLFLSTTDKPLVLGEFGWYGGGELRVDDRVQLPSQPVEHQADWCCQLLALSRGRLAGWLNWAFADTPTSRDLTRWSGCWTQQLELKPWGRKFGQFAADITSKADEPRRFPTYLTSFDFDRKAMLTSPEAGNAYRERLHKARIADQPQTRPHFGNP